MIFYKFRALIRSNSIKPNTFVLVASLVLFALIWFVPLFLGYFQIELFGIPLPYFYIILAGPVLILFFTSWAVGFVERLDRNQLETEND